MSRETKYCEEKRSWLGEMSVLHMHMHWSLFMILHSLDVQYLTFDTACKTMSGIETCCNFVAEGRKFENTKTDSREHGSAALQFDSEVALLFVP